MKYPRSKHLLILTLCLGLTSPVFVNAEPVERDHRDFKHTSRNFGPHRMFKLLHKLDVSDEQHLAIGEIMDQHRPSMRQFMLDMKNGQNALQTILTSENFDSQKIEQLAADQAQNAEKMFLATAKAFADISAILIPEQRVKLAESIEKRGERWKDKREDRRGRWRNRDKERDDSPHVEAAPTES